MKKLIDCYGIPANDSDYRTKKLDPVKVIEDGDNTYLFFDGKEKGVVQRIRTSGSETYFEFAYGLKTNYKNLDYVPVSEVLLIED